MPIPYNNNNFEYTRPSIFKDLLKSQIDDDNVKLMIKGLLSTQYNEFIKFCDEVKKDFKVLSVSAYYEGNKVIFEKNYK